ncbi:hypothetical protein QAD02_010260 [Eretmocerus hayati]|uniref:Uncharacterized protein n=1 Tax=Eretmocerus hayati TaxID=131215 RepID=A0ACC2NBQ8_9HYME|nr:hypothetical protein QAD02_010260 [Eretmocerus hayati]
MNLRVIACLSLALIICINVTVDCFTGAIEKPYIGPSPSVVALEYYKKYICGGTMISTTLILTAAHCLVGKWPAMLRVQLHVEQNLIRKGDPGLRVKNIAYNPAFHSVDYINDVGLVQLTEPINLSRGLRIVELSSTPRGGQEHLQSFAVIAIEFKVQTIEKVEVDYLKPISTHSCAQKYNITENSLANQWCVELPEEKNWVFRYTGGPVMAHVGGKFVQMGIVSTSWACGDKVPEVVTDISAVKPWIDQASDYLSKTDNKSPEIHPLSEDELNYYRRYYGIPMRREWVTFLASIVSKNTGALSCVGTIISRTHVLTTAECAIHYESKKIRVGSYDKVAYGEIAFDILNATSHPGYEYHVATSPNLAVLRIDGKFTFDSKTNKAIMSTQTKQYDPESYGNVYGMVPGKGAQSFEVSTLPKEECSWLLYHDPSKLNKQICTKRRTGLCIDGGNGATNGGAPLFVGGRLAAVLSWTTDDCADYRRPQIYTSVAEYLSWIESFDVHNDREPDSIVNINETDEANDVNSYHVNVEKDSGGL